MYMYMYNGCTCFFFLDLPPPPPLLEVYGVYPSELLSSTKLSLPKLIMSSSYSSPPTSDIYMYIK